MGTGFDKLHHDDLLKILETTDSATVDEVKAAYKKKALKVHPDRIDRQIAQENLSEEQAIAKKAASTELFQKLGFAFEILKGEAEGRARAASAGAEPMKSEDQEESKPARKPSEPKPRPTPAEEEEDDTPAAGVYERKRAPYEFDLTSATGVDERKRRPHSGDQDPKFARQAFGEKTGAVNNKASTGTADPARSKTSKASAVDKENAVPGNENAPPKPQKKATASMPATKPIRSDFYDDVDDSVLSPYDDQLRGFYREADPKEMYWRRHGKTAIWKPCVKVTVDAAYKSKWVTLVSQYDVQAPQHVTKAGLKSDIVIAQEASRPRSMVVIIPRKGWTYTIAFDATLWKLARVAKTDARYDVIRNDPRGCPLELEGSDYIRIR